MNVKALNAQVLSEFPGPAIWWLGQAGFLLKSKSGKYAVVDPYLSDSLARKYEGRLFPHTRLHPAPISPEQLPPISLFLSTHGHTDHMDPDTLSKFAREEEYSIVCPSSQQERAIARGAEPEFLTTVNAGDYYQFEDFQIIAIPAAHEELSITELGLYEALGFVIKFDDFTLYHSGDCTPFKGLSHLLLEHRPQLALLPINGRDAYRLENGVPGNFFPEEAVALCVEAGIPNLVPHHWGLFDFNTVSIPQAQPIFERSTVQVTVPIVGEPIDLLTMTDAVEHA